MNKHIIHGPAVPVEGFHSSHHALHGHKQHQHDHAAAPVFVRPEYLHENPVKQISRGKTQHQQHDPRGHHIGPLPEGARRQRHQEVGGKISHPAHPVLHRPHDSGKKHGKDRMSAYPGLTAVAPYGIVVRTGIIVPADPQQGNQASQIQRRQETRQPPWRDLLSQPDPCPLHFLHDIPIVLTAFLPVHIHFLLTPASYNHYRP